MSAAAIVAAARACLGTPFLHQGRLPGVGLDCAGLAVVVARAIGADYLDQTGYGRMPIDNRLRAALDAQPCLAPAADPGPGAVLLLRLGRDPQHIAILTEDSIIHAWETVGMVCEHRLDDEWRRRIVAAWRFKEIA